MDKSDKDMPVDQKVVFKVEKIDTKDNSVSEDAEEVNGNDEKSQVTQTTIVLIMRTPMIMSTTTTVLNVKLFALMVIFSQDSWLFYCLVL